MKLSLVPKAAPALKSAFLREHIAQLVDRVVLETGVKPEAIYGGGRSAKVVNARWRAWAALLNDGMSISEIAAVFHVDHTSVIYGLRKLLGQDVYKASVRARCGRVERVA
jgi:chromosomal replication initiation ATPase DnaA